MHDLSGWKYLAIMAELQKPIFHLVDFSPQQRLLFINIVQEPYLRQTKFNHGTRRMECGIHIANIKLQRTIFKSKVMKSLG